MKYQELMDTCSNIWREYIEEGNSFLGLCEARRYCVRHIAECEDATQEQISQIQNWYEYKELQAEIQQEKHKEEILNNQKENPTEYKQGLWICEVKLKYTDRMVLRYDGVHWFQYLPQNLMPNLEGWIGVDFEFEPIELIKELC